MPAPVPDLVARLWEKGVAPGHIRLERVRLAGPGLVARERPIKETRRLAELRVQLGGNEYRAYFPKPAHAAAFKESAETNMRDGGPHVWCPGAVGALHAYRTYHPDGRLKDIAILFMQGIFVQGKPASLTRSVVSKYGGWREHLLADLFEESRATGAPLSLVFPPQAPPGGKDNARVFTQTAKKFGFDLREEPGGKPDAPDKALIATANAARK